MPFKMKKSNKFQRAISKGNDGLIAQVRKRFSEKGAIKVKQAIVQDMIKGISPVKGFGKWKKYSDSYKEVIRGKAAYRNVGGKVIRFSADEPWGISDSEFNSLRPNASAKRSRRTAKDIMKQKIKDLNQDFRSKMSPVKNISPVNLRLSGDLHRSLKSFTKGGFLSNFRLVLQFKNKLADIHNRLGAGKSKVVRRLLPTKQGERFNNKIERVVLDQVKQAVNYVSKQFNRQ